MDAGAIDYDLVQTKELSELRWKIREKLWDAKEGWLSSRKSRSWFQWLIGSQGDLLPPSNPNYNVDESYIALGPEVWDEMMLGMNEGCLGNRPHVQVKEVLSIPVIEESENKEIVETNTKEEIQKDESSQETQKTQEKENETPPKNEEEISPKSEEETPKVDDKEIQKPLNPSDLSIDNLNAYFPIPSIGFIPAYDQVGWKAFPKRIFGFFHERHTFETVGQETLKIVLGSKRPCLVNEIVYEKDNVMLNLNEPLVAKTLIHT